MGAHVVLKEDGGKYSGKFVATVSFKDPTVVSSGKNPTRVLREARRKAKDPVIFYVPKKNMVHIY